MDCFKFLPEEIKLDILSRLPTESVLECKLVSKTWNYLVHHPLFSKVHLHRLNHPSDADSSKFGFLAFTEFEKSYYFEYDEENHELKPIQRFRNVNMTSPLLSMPVRFVGSCNGLICLVGGQFVWICNPITREEVMLPEIKRDCDTYEYRFLSSFGFGHVNSTNEYKVVGIHSFKTNVAVEVHIYTIGSGRGWRNLGKFDFGSNLDLDVIGLFANGALYWTGKAVEMILTLDLAEEKFCEQLAPPPLPPDNVFRKRLEVLDGFLVFSAGPIEDRFYDIWLLKRKNDQSLGWSKEFQVDDCKLLTVTKSGDIITYVKNYINMYDAITLTSKTIWHYDERFSQIFPHKNTLISLEELGEEATETMESLSHKSEDTESCD